MNRPAKRTADPELPRELARSWAFSKKRNRKWASELRPDFTSILEFGAPIDSENEILRVDSKNWLIPANFPKTFGDFGAHFGALLDHFGAVFAQYDEHSNTTNKMAKHAERPGHNLHAIHP